MVLKPTDLAKDKTLLALIEAKIQKASSIEAFCIVAESRNTDHKNTQTIRSLLFKKRPLLLRVVFGNNNFGFFCLFFDKAFSIGCRTSGNFN
jgi:hypothetical protein